MPVAPFWKVTRDIGVARERAAMGYVRWRGGERERRERPRVVGGGEDDESKAERTLDNDRVAGDTLHDAHGRVDKPRLAPRVRWSRGMRGRAPRNRDGWTRSEDKWGRGGKRRECARVLRSDLASKGSDGRATIVGRDRSRGAVQRRGHRRLCEGTRKACAPTSLPPLPARSSLRPLKKPRAAFAIKVGTVAHSRPTASSRLPTGIAPQRRRPLFTPAYLRAAAPRRGEIVKAVGDQNHIANNVRALQRRRGDGARVRGSAGPSLAVALQPP